MSTGSIFIGQAIFNILNLIWCVSYLETLPAQSAITIVLAIILPCITGTLSFFIAIKGCCCKQNIIYRDICQSLTLALLAMFHIFGWHAGYLIGPISLIIAALLPSKYSTYTFGSTKYTNDMNEVS